MPERVTKQMIETLEYLVNNEGVRLKAVAPDLGLKSRQAARQRLMRLAQLGLAEERDKGWFATDEGRRILAQGPDETGGDSKRRKLARWFSRKLNDPATKLFSAFTATEMLNIVLDSPVGYFETVFSSRKAAESVLDYMVTKEELWNGTLFYRVATDEGAGKELLEELETLPGVGRNKAHKAVTFMWMLALLVQALRAGAQSGLFAPSVLELMPKIHTAVNNLGGEAEKLDLEARLSSFVQNRVAHAQNTGLQSTRKEGNDVNTNPDGAST